MHIYHHSQEEQYGEHCYNESSVLKIQNLQIALERAIQDISTLQKNLTFVIEIKEQLQKQLQIRDKKNELLIKQYQRQLYKKNNEIQSLKLHQTQLSQLLDDTKQALTNRQTCLIQYQEEKKRYQRILSDQKYTIGMLEEQLLATKYSEDLSYQSINFDNTKIQQMQKENDNLTIELTRLKNQSQKERFQHKKMQKVYQQFKTWLGSVLGIKKVIQGCEHLLMDEISARINNNIMRY